MAENSEHQCSFAEALCTATAQLQMSPGAAEIELIEACRCGTIRSYVLKALIGENLEVHSWRDRIDRAEWETRDIFVLTARAELSTEDLQYWLATKSKIAAAPAALVEPRDTSEEACRKLIASISKEETAEAPQRKHPGGSPPTYNLVEIKLFFQQLLKDRGDPTDEKDQIPGWESIEDAMKVIRDHMEERGGAPQKTRFREILNGVLADYRRDLADASAN
jgi:hypothetical protein